MFDSWIQDVRYAARALRSHPTFTLVAVATLALGIGATSTLFTVVDAVLLRPLPYPGSGRLVSMSEYSHGHDQHVAPEATIRVWHAAHSLDGLAVYAPNSAVLTGHGEPVQLGGSSVTPDYFNLLGVRPVVGRLFVPGDTAAAATDVVVLGDKLWHDRFGGDRSIVGHTIDLDGTPTVVIGVIPDLNDISSAAFWQPLRIPPPAPGEMYFYGALARLAPHVTLASARSELAALARRADATRPISQRGAGVVVMTLHDRLFGSMRPALLMIFGAGCFLLLIACSNVANLLLARAASRQHEIGVRVALGAGRARLARQIITESVLLSLIGAGVGMAIPVWAVGVFVRLSPDNISRLSHATANLRVVAFAGVAGVVTGLVFGAIPAWLATRRDALQWLAGGTTRTTGGRGQLRVRRALVSLELATALVLLTGAGLMTRSFLNVLAVDPGYRPDHLLSAVIRLPRARYDAPQARAAFFERLLRQIRTIPGVGSAALTDAAPTAGFSMSTTLAALTHTPDSTPVSIVDVGRDYPRTIGLGVVAGRLFDTADAGGSPVPALASAAAARALFPHGNAVGQLLPASAMLGGPLRIVGVVKDVPQLGLDVAPLPQVYLLDNSDDESAVVLRADGDITRFEPAIRRMVASIDPAQPVASFVKIDDAAARLLAPRRLNFLLFNVFAAIALALAAVGVYGVMAMQVAERNREMGIRLALGAHAQTLVGLMVRQGVTMVLVGCGTGLVLSMALSRIIASLLYDVGARDAAVFVGAPVMLCAVALLACYLPARRASRVDPVAVLRD